MNILSPLRYPGGKTKIYGEVSNLINKCELNDLIYVEPFGGGFGVGLELLINGIVDKAILNDFDVHVYYFWWCVFNKTEELVKKIHDTEISLEERERQKRLFAESKDPLEIGFATLFLNRVNFSGIINGGPLGGPSQKSKYKIDCRFNKDDIIDKIVKISSLKSRIELYNYDACYLISDVLNERLEDCFFNMDPPYVINGKQLYTSYFIKEQHVNFAEVVKTKMSNCNWIVTYDECDLVRDLYSDFFIQEFTIWHSAKNQAKKKELVITNIKKDKFVWTK